jgi:hypothetical protein
VAIVAGTVSAIRVHMTEGAGSAITAQIATIIFAVLILPSVSIAAAFAREANSAARRDRLENLRYRDARCRSDQSRAALSPASPRSSHSLAPCPPIFCVT